MRICSWLLWPLPALLATSLPAQQPAAKAADQPASEFVRFVQDGDDAALDTAIVTYRNGDVEVILFAAVHIADQACYELLNDRFAACDALLYELVASPNDKPKRGEHGSSPVSMLQTLLKETLELAFQLDVIDYGAPNFVHADMTPREFAESMAERGESMFTMMFELMSKGALQQRRKAAAADDDDDAADDDGDGKKSPAVAAPSFDLARAWRQRRGHHTLRLMFASQLQQIELLAAPTKKDGSTLLEGRNEKCLAVLQREIAAGKKKLGIYYGAAHLPHLERRLLQDLGFTRTGHEWITAWDCTARDDPAYNRELVQQRQRCKDELAALASFARDYRVAVGGKPPELADYDPARASGGPRYTGPLRDPWGGFYRIEARQGAARWQVRSAGPDGEFGNADDLLAQEPRRAGLGGR